MELKPNPRKNEAHFLFLFFFTLKDIIVVSSILFGSFQQANSWSNKAGHTHTQTHRTSFDSRIEQVYENEFKGKIK